MDFIDWRKSPQKIKVESQENIPKVHKYRGKSYIDYIDEQIREAQARGDFDNLAGAGKPLNLDENIYAGDKALGYNLLKSNGFAPIEVELTKEVRNERTRAEKKLARVIHMSKTLRKRRVPPSASEKHAFNLAVHKAADEYEHTVRELNRKILTVNLTVPAAMQQTPIHVEEVVQHFREQCPLFAEV